MQRDGNGRAGVFNSASTRYVGIYTRTATAPTITGPAGRSDPSFSAGATLTGRGWTAGVVREERGRRVLRGGQSGDKSSP